MLGFVHQKLLLLIALVLALIIFSTLAAVFFPETQFPMSRGVEQRIPPPAPAYTPERSVEAQRNASFSSIVSYADQGFEPTAVTVNADDVIRFVNNATVPLALSLDGAPELLQPGEYWQQAFRTAGDVLVRNTLHPDTALTIHVLGI